MSEIRVDSLSNESNTGGPVLSGITTFSGQKYFIPPKGSTAERPQDCPPGSIRFNTDTLHLEYWNGLVWLEFEASSPELGNNLSGVSKSTQGTGVRGVFTGNRTVPTAPSSPKSEYITISTLGDSVDFGTLTQQVALHGSFASSTRGVFFGGYNVPIAGARTARIAGFTFASISSHVDFSSTTSIISQHAVGLSNETRGICFLGTTFPDGVSNKIEYVTIASVASTKDFGDLTGVRAGGISFSSSVRGVYAGGYTPSFMNTIQYITISTLGNARDFGDLSENSHAGAGGGNATRGIRLGGGNPTAQSTIEFVNIATTGNTQDFGDLINPMQNGCLGNVSSPTRSIAAGGYQSSNENMIQYITNSTAGTAIDFGNLTENKYQFSGASNGHGGL